MFSGTTLCVPFWHMHVRPRLCFCWLIIVSWFLAPQLPSSYGRGRCMVHGARASKALNNQAMSRMRQIISFFVVLLIRNKPRSRRFASCKASMKQSINKFSILQSTTGSTNIPHGAICQFLASLVLPGRQNRIALYCGWQSQHLEPCLGDLTCDIQKFGQIIVL